MISRVTTGRALILLASVTAVVALVAAMRPTVPNVHVAGAAVRRYLVDVAALDSAADRLRDAAARGDTAAARTALAATRLAYKRVEFLAEHYTPLTARGLNGPPVLAADDENPRLVVLPTGLQVIDEALHDPEGARLADAAQGAAMARVHARRLRETALSTIVTPEQLFDAARLEVARVTTLGMAGADTRPGAEVGIEAAAAIDATCHALDGVGDGTPARIAFDRRCAEAIADLRAQPAATLDRYRIIVARLNPLAHALVALRAAAGIPTPTDRRVFITSAATVFDVGALDPGALAPPGTPAPTAALIALGRTLFAEPALSGRGDRSCATCHRPDHAFADGRVRAVTTSGAGDSTLRNTPTLLHAALQPNVLADARFAFLEDQVGHVIASPAEMAGRLDSAVARLGRRVEYRTQFGGAVTPRAIQQALAAYVRTLAVPDAPFDRAMRGDDAAMDTESRRGFDLFMGKARCATCHFPPLFGGAVPPSFTESEAEVLGVPSTTVGRDARVDTDPGVGGLDGSALHQHAFRTPSLRNIARTAPYMHNGVYRTLDDVIDFYDRGGGVGIGVALPNVTLPSDSLHLTRAEKHAIVAFLRTLDDARP